MDVEDLRKALEVEARAAYRLSEAAQDYAGALWIDPITGEQGATLDQARRNYEAAVTKHAYAAIASGQAQPTTTEMEN